jgi:hypothetical protein
MKSWPLFWFLWSLVTAPLLFVEPAGLIFCTLIIVSSLMLARQYLSGGVVSKDPVVVPNSNNIRTEVAPEVERAGRRFSDQPPGFTGQFEAVASEKPAVKVGDLKDGR